MSLRRFFDWALVALGAAMTALLVHIVAILIIPLFATNDSFARLSRLGPLNVTLSLPAASPTARLIPYGDPAVAVAFCRYDLSNGPLRVKAAVERFEFSSLSFHTRRGSIFYALTDRAATHGALEALVVTEEQLRAIAAKDSEDEPSQELRIVSATNEGFVMMRALSEEPSLYPQAEARARALQCAREPAPR